MTLNFTEKIGVSQDINVEINLLMNDIRESRQAAGDRA